MSLRLLTSDMFESFLERFDRFGDGTVMKVELDWQRIPSRCVLIVDADDNSLADQPFSGSRVVFRIDEVLGFSWPADWKGSIECSKIHFCDYGSSIVLTVANSLLRPSDPQSFYNERETPFFVHGRHVYYEVLPHPLAARWSSRPFTTIERVRVKPDAPSRYRPGAIGRTFQVRPIEPGEEGDLPVGTLVYGVRYYADRSAAEIPEYWLESCGGPQCQDHWIRELRYGSSE